MGTQPTTSPGGRARVFSVCCRWHGPIKGAGGHRQVEVHACGTVIRTCGAPLLVLLVLLLLLLQLLQLLSCPPGRAAGAGSSPVATPSTPEPVLTVTPLLLSGGLNARQSPSPGCCAPAPLQSAPSAAKQRKRMLGWWHGAAAG